MTKEKEKQLCKHAMVEDYEDAVTEEVINLIASYAGRVMDAVSCKDCVINALSDLFDVAYDIGFDDAVKTIKSVIEELED